MPEQTGSTETFSRFGGLWIDRVDSDDLLRRKLDSGLISVDLYRKITNFTRDGFIVLENVVPRDLTRAIREELGRFWEYPPEGALIENWTDGKLQFVPPQMSLRGGVTKLLDFHAFSELARQAIASPQVIEFLSAIFEESPKAFQSLTFWKGSQQAMHKDTAYVQVEPNPMRLAATWIALEDIRPGTGELEYYVGSHRDPDFLFERQHKWMPINSSEHQSFLESMHADAAKYNHEKKSFLAKEGDVLIWHADLAHGGSAITNKDATRQSLVTHFTTSSQNPPYMKRVFRQAVEKNGCSFISQYSRMRPGSPAASGFIGSPSWEAGFQWRSQLRFK